jgi:Zn finger protein HypA/HybF involved in hydrogenase expression
MTSSPYPVECECRHCGERWTDYVRASIDLSLPGEVWTDDQIREATMVRCPRCGADESATGAMIVSWD